jgi:hypothetical protein
MAFVLYRYTGPGGYTNIDRVLPFLRGYRVEGTAVWKIAFYVLVSIKWN